MVGNKAYINTKNGISRLENIYWEFIRPRGYFIRKKEKNREVKTKGISPINSP